MWKGVHMKLFGMKLTRRGEYVFYSGVLAGFVLLMGFVGGIETAGIW